MNCGSGGSISRLANAAGAEPVGQMGDEKNHAIVVPSTCPSQNVQSTPFSDRLEVEMSKECQKCLNLCPALNFQESNFFSYLRTLSQSFFVRRTLQFQKPNHATRKCFGPEDIELRVSLLSHRHLEDSMSQTAWASDFAFSSDTWAAIVFKSNLYVLNFMWESCNVSPESISLGCSEFTGIWIYIPCRSLDDFTRRAPLSTQHQNTFSMHSSRS